MSRSSNTSSASDTESRCSAVSNGPSKPSAVSTGSGNHGPMYCSRWTRADVSRFRHRLVTTFASHAGGVTIVAWSAPFQRRKASWTTSSASSAEPSMR